METEPIVAEPVVKSWEVPDAGNLTPAGAEQLLAKINADALGDLKHPYSFGQHPQHKAFKALVTRLHEIKADPRTPLEKTMAEGMKDMEGRQSNLVLEANKEMDKLHSLGFAVAAVPNDIKQYQLTALKMQRLTAERDYGNLLPIVEKEAQKLNAPQDIGDLLALLRQSPHLSPDIKEGTYEKVVEWIFKANKSVYE